jgi:hypothetical protein
MPTYTFINTENDEEFSEFMSMSERDDYLRNNPHIKQTILSATPLCDPTRVGVRTKPDSGFRDVLQNIKGKFHKSNINTF